MREKKFNLADLQGTNAKELKEFTKLDDRQLDQAIRKKMDGGRRADYHEALTSLYGIKNK